MTTGKTIALTRWTFVGKVMSLLLNMLSRESHGLFIVGVTVHLMLSFYDNILQTSLFCVSVYNFKLPAPRKCHYTAHKTTCLRLKVHMSHAACFKAFMVGSI